MDEMPLQPQIVVGPFDKWGIDFGGPIEPSSQEKSYILVCTGYVTKWAEAKPMKHPRDNNMEKFLYESIFTWFGVPWELQSNQGPQFTSNLITALMEENKIHHGKSSPYHPQANIKVEVTNHELEAILTKMVSLHKKDQASILLEALWAYRIAWKSTTGFSPFELLYGKSVVMPIKFEHKKLRTPLDLGMDLPTTQCDIILHLNGYAKWCKLALHNTELIEQQCKQWHDKFIKD